MPLYQQPKPREMSWRDPILPTQDEHLNKNMK